MGKARLKQVRGKNQDTKEAKENWKLLHDKYSGSTVETKFVIPEGATDEWEGYYWEMVLNWRKHHPDQPVVNIIALMGKSTRKSTVFAADVIKRISRESYLYGVGARDTDDRSKSELDELFMNTKNIMVNELNLDFLEEVFIKGTNTWWFVKDSKRKDNKNIELTSFEKIIKKGGFIKPVISLWDELVNPDATENEIPGKEEFLHNLKLINSKNRENFLAAGADYKAFATNLFAMNRWSPNHPLVMFAEEHFPYNEIEEEFLKDPMNNNFAVKYVGKANDGWKALNETLIVYGTKFSNDMIANDESLVDQLLEDLENGSQGDRGIILGSEFEGVSSPNKVYQFAAEDWYMHSLLPKKPHKIAYSVDYDYNQEISFLKHNLMVFDEEEVIEEFGHKVYAIITEPVNPLITKNMHQNGKGVFVEEWIVDKMKSYVEEGNYEIPVVHAYHDNDQATTIDNYNHEKRHNLKATHNIHSKKPTKHGFWDIEPRVKFMNDAVPKGFVSLIDNPAAKRLKREFYICKVEPGKKSRDERPGKQMLNIINTLEYGVAPWSKYKSKFPTGFWEWWNKFYVGK